MSEELIQKGLDKQGIKFGNYQWYNIGNTSLNQLKTYKIIPNKNYKEYGNLKPDGLLVDRRDKKKIQVITVVEFKKSENLNTESKKEKAVKQCNTYCQILNAKFGVITDNQEFIYINPNVDNQNFEIKYNDKNIFNNKLDCERYFNYIRREDGYLLSKPFILDKENKNETKSTCNLIKKILNTISKNSSQLKKIEYKDPSVLAKSIWQDVWMSKNASPEKSLSTFVEIFIFKFLSDLGVLIVNSSGAQVSFDHVFNNVNKELCYKYYWDNVRKYLKELFPANVKDKTTLINGISLQPDIPEDNHVFYTILKKFHDYGSLRNIDPEFKSRLFEDFLKNSISKKNWGRFFTPRNVVKAMIEMSEIEKLPDGAKICDPACGVGGFILEPIITKRTNDYYFENDKLKCKLNYFGFEKAVEEDDALTITLAKANFLIYLSDLLNENPTMTKEFAKLYNKIFKMYTQTNLGSLSEVKENEYDLIMSNPPYAVSGSSNYKIAIKNDAKLKNFYKVNATGTEGLFLEKMIRELKPKGTALIVIPDGILKRDNDLKLRKFIKNECIINAIISLPENTFYTTPKKTYIISITKKESETTIQNSPVFTYIASNIGETLDMYRFMIEENDLTDMVKQYKYFMTDKKDYESQNLRCKKQPIELFENSTRWFIDTWWTNEEKIKLGIEEKATIKSIEDLEEDILTLKNTLETLREELENKVDTCKLEYIELNEVIDFSIGTNRSWFTKSFVNDNKGDIPVYSASKDPKVKYGYIMDNMDNVKYFENCLTWNIDGSIGKVHYRKGKFSLSEKVIPLIIKNEYKENLDLFYLKYSIEKEAVKYGFVFSNKAGKSKIKVMRIPIPVSEGKFDLEKQHEIAKKHIKIEKIKKELMDYLTEITKSEIDFGY